MGKNDYEKHLPMQTFLDGKKYPDFTKPLDKTKQFRRETFRKGYSTFKILQEGNDVQAATAMFGSPEVAGKVLSNPEISVGQFLGARQYASEKAGEGVYGYTVRNARSMTKLTHKENLPGLMNFGVQIARDDLLFEGHPHWVRYNSTIKKIRKEGAELNKIDADPEAFLGETLKPLGEYGQGLFAFFGNVIIDDFRAHHTTQIHHGIAGKKIGTPGHEMGYHGFLGANVEMADSWAKAQIYAEQQVLAQEAKTKAEKDKQKKDLEAIAQAHDNSKDRAPVLAVSLADLTYNSLPAAA